MSNVTPLDSSNALTGFAGSEAGAGPTGTLGFTVGRMMTDNISIEMLGIYPSSHHIRGNKGGINGLDVGSVDIFPPTFHVNYYLNPKSDLRYRVGAGFSTVFFLNKKVAAPTKAALGATTELEVNDTIGIAGNVGVDYDINDNWMMSLGVWYSHFSADATLKTGTTSRHIDIDLNPIVGLFGVGYKF